MFLNIDILCEYTRIMTKLFFYHSFASYLNHSVCFAILSSEKKQSFAFYVPFFPFILQHFWSTTSPHHLAETCAARGESKPWRGEMEGVNSLSETDSTRSACPVSLLSRNIFMAIFSGLFLLLFYYYGIFWRKASIWITCGNSLCHMEWNGTSLDETLDPFETQPAT